MTQDPLETSLGKPHELFILRSSVLDTASSVDRFSARDYKMKHF